MCSSPSFYFDAEIYQLTEAGIRALDNGTLSCLLGSSGESARFTAALIMDPDSTPRIIPVLFEMLNWAGIRSHAIVVQLSSQPVESLATAQLEKLSEATLNAMDLHLLNPSILGDDPAAEYAVTLALRSTDSTYVRSLLMQAQRGSGPAILRKLVSFYRTDDAFKPRAAALLNAARTDWLASFLSSQNKLTVISAAYALALRGDASGFPQALVLLPQGEACLLLFTCHPYRDLATELMEKLTVSLPAATRLAINVPSLRDYPDNAIVALTDMVVRHGDDAAFERLMTEFANLPGPDDWLIRDVAGCIPIRFSSKLEELAQAQGPSGKSSLVGIVKQVRTRNGSGAQ